MATTSIIFFGLLLVPLVALLIWLIRQDRNRSYWGIILLVAGMALAAYSIIKLDEKYTSPSTNQAPRPSNFR